MLRKYPLISKSNYTNCNQSYADTNCTNFGGVATIPYDRPGIYIGAAEVLYGGKFLGGMFFNSADSDLSSKYPSLNPFLRVVN
jgi:hypothetical protein